ncbi:MAG: NAD-dependent epimerase/dehydratase family protein [Myxococcota bacterium]
MHILVTGANGFIGTHLVRALCAEGHNVTSVIFPKSDGQELQILGSTLLEADLTRPPEPLRKALTQVDQVYHVAGARIGLHAKHFYRVNTEGTRMLLSVCRERNPKLQRFILVSSATVCGSSPANQAADESHSRPKTPYAKSKYAAEQVALKEFPDIPVTVLRPSAIYGPRTTEWVEMLNLCTRWRRYAIFGVFRKEPRMDLCYIDDLIEGMMQAANHPDTRGEIFILNGPHHSWSEIGQQAATALRVHAKPLYVPMPILFFAAACTHLFSLLLRKPFEFNWWRAIDFAQPNWTFSSQKAQSVFGYQPKTPFPQGVDQTVQSKLRDQWIAPPRTKHLLPPPDTKSSTSA